MITNTNSRQVNCHHEAAHAVIAVSLGLGARTLWISDTWNYGFLHILEEGDRFQDRFALVLAAGHAAEMLLCGWAEGSQGDMLDHQTLFGGKPYDSPGWNLRWDRDVATATNMLVKSWPSVERVSAELASRRFLAFRDILASM